MSTVSRSDIGALAGGVDLNDLHAGQFRHVQTLSFSTGGEAETAHVADGTVLDVRFLTRFVDALSPDAPEAAQLSTDGGDLVLALPVARRINRLRLSDPVSGDNVSAFRFDGDAVSDDPVTTRAHGSAGAPLNVTDAQMILRRKNNGVEYALTPGAIDEVVLRYAPVNPRLSLRLTGTDNDIPFPAKLDADGAPVFPGSAGFAAEFETALQTLLSTVPQPLPDPLQIDLILSSDQPCRVRVDALSVRLELEKQAFSEKALLRFSGGRRQQETVALSLPSGAQVIGGRLSLSVAGTPPSARVQTAIETASLTATDQGVPVSAERPVATQIVLPAPMAAAGAEMIFAVPDGACTLRAAFHADHKGAPGDALGESAPVDVSTARPTVVRFSFDPLALPAGPVWLSVSAQSGRAVAMIGEAGQIARGEGPYFSVIKGLEGQGLAALIRAAETAPSAGTPSTGPIVALQGVPLGAVTANGATDFDLATFASQLAVGAQLTISSAARAVVTIDPMVVRYQMPG